MPDHMIKFKLPTIELTGQDLVFEVYIDRKKDGELRLSEGGLDWWPKGAKTRKHVKTWTQLRAFMENET